MTLVVGAQQIPLFSSHLYAKMVKVALDPVLVVAKSYWDIGRGHDVLNAVELQLLRDTQVVYGDEQRIKMQHVASADVYEAELEDAYVYHLAPFLKQYQHTFLPEEGNLHSVTTLKAREYHYAKHAKNAFYHMETINLPFHEFRFSYTG